MMQPGRLGRGRLSPRIFKFTNDGKKLLQTIGTPNEHASDDKHF
jgi:hypothetical protein